MSILSAIAQAERRKMAERTNEGRQDAKLEGIRFGGRRTVDRDNMLSVCCQGIGATGISRQLLLLVQGFIRSG